MIAYNRWSDDEFRPPSRPKPPMQDITVKFGQLDSQDTSYRFMLKDNPRGRFLRITAKSGEAVCGIIVPDAGLEDFAARLGKLAVAAKSMAGHGKVEEMRFGTRVYTFTCGNDMRGERLSIVERAGMYINEIIVAATVLDGFVNWVSEMVRASRDLPLAAPAGTDAIRAVETLKTKGIQITHKTFTFLLQKNPRGTFMRIVEDQERGHNSIVIPTEGLNEFRNLIMEMARASKKPAQ